MTLTTEFDPDVNSYTGTATDDGELEFTLENPLADVVVKLGSTEVEAVDGVYTLEFTTGSNTVTVKVVGTETNTYTFTITAS